MMSFFKVYFKRIQFFYALFLISFSLFLYVYFSHGDKMFQIVLTLLSLGGASLCFSKGSWSVSLHKNMSSFSWEFFDGLPLNKKESFILQRLLTFFKGAPLLMMASFWFPILGSNKKHTFEITPLFSLECLILGLFFLIIIDSWGSLIMLSKKRRQHQILPVYIQWIKSSGYFILYFFFSLLFLFLFSSSSSLTRLGSFFLMTAISLSLSYSSFIHFEKSYWNPRLGILNLVGFFLFLGLVIFMLVSQ